MQIMKSKIVENLIDFVENELQIPSQKGLIDIVEPKSSRFHELKYGKNPR